MQRNLQKIVNLNSDINVIQGPMRKPIKDAKFALAPIPSV